MEERYIVCPSGRGSTGAHRAACVKASGAASSIMSFVLGSVCPSELSGAGAGADHRKDVSP